MAKKKEKGSIRRREAREIVRWIAIDKVQGCLAKIPLRWREQSFGYWL